MKTSIDYALKHPQVKDDLKQYIIDLGKQLEASEQTADSKRRKRDFILTSFFYIL